MGVVGADLQSVIGLCCYGNITRTRNVSKYMLVLALSLVLSVGARVRAGKIDPSLTRAVPERLTDELYSV